MKKLLKLLLLASIVGSIVPLTAFAVDHHHDSAGCCYTDVKVTEGGITSPGSTVDKRNYSGSRTTAHRPGQGAGVGPCPVGIY